jgi:VanZ family protein
MACISLFSTAEFSSVNTSRFLEPLLHWFFPRISESQIATIHLVIRKGGHLSEYAMLAFLARRAFVNSSKTLLQRHWFGLAFLLIACYALLDEFHQSFVPSRTPSIYDSLIDVIGGLTVLVIFKFYDQRASRQRRNPAN